jgi:hypothetical protein
MSNNDENVQMDLSELVREETYTDQKVGTIRCLVPVTETGVEDISRKKQFFGQAQVMTPGGALPINFEIEALTLKEAVEGYGAAAQVGLENTMEELKEMRRQQASSIVIPGQEGMGGMPGGGIQMP